MILVICEDNDKERLKICNVIKRYFIRRDEMVTICEYMDGETLLFDVQEGYVKPDIFFLDIYMNEMTGIELAHKLREHQIIAPLIFITNTAEFAVESYDVEASGYLLKPLNEEKLIQIMDRILKSMKRKCLQLSVGHEELLVYVNEITWVESRDHKLFIHMKNGEVLQFRDKLNSFEDKLNAPCFLRCHQSFLVNMDDISRVDGDFFMLDGSRIPIRVRSAKQIIETYHRYLMAQAIEELPGGDAYA